MMRQVLALVAAWVMTSSSVAAPPEVTYLYPAGGAVGSTVEVRAGGKLDPWPVQAWCEDPALKLEAGKAKGTFQITIAPDAKPGVRWIRFHNPEGASALRPFIVNEVSEAVEKEPNDAPEKAQSLAEQPVVVNGQLAKSGDVDVFSLPLKAGQTLIASLLANRVLGSPMDAHLQILSPEGFLLAENNDEFGLDPQVVVTVPKDGTYLARVFAFPETPNSTIRFAGGENYIYRLTLTAGKWVDHPFPLAVEAGKDDPIQFRGWNLNDAGGVSLKRTDSVVSRKEPHPCIVEMEPKNRDEAQSVTTPVTISGHIGEAGDVDRFRFSAKKNQSLLIRIDARAGGSPLDPVLRVLDATGKLLKEVDDVSSQADPEFALKVPVDGEYVAEVRDLFGHGSWRHWYRISIAEPVPDFEVSVATDRFLGAVGKPIDIAVNVNRLHGFADAIAFRIEGLPASAKLIGTPTSADAKAKKVTIQVQGTEAFSGPIRILGTSGKQIHTAGDHSWLTVRAAGK